MGRSFGGLERGPALLRNGAFRALHHGVKRHVVGLVAHVHRGQVHRPHHQSVQGVARGVLPLGRHGRVPEKRVLVFPREIRRGLLLDHHLPQRQGARFVGAEHVHPRQRFDAVEFRHDGFLVGQRLAPDAHGGGGHDGERDGDGGDDEHGAEGQRLERAFPLRDEVDEHDGGHHERAADHGLHDGHEHHLEVRRLLYAVDHGGGLAEERVGARRAHDGLVLSPHHHGAHLGDVVAAHGDGQRLPGQRGLVDLHGGALAHAAVGGDGSARGDHHAVPGNQSARVHVGPHAVALHLGFRLEGGFEGGDGVPRAHGLVVGNAPVDHLQQKEHHEVEPVLHDPLDDDREPNHVRHGSFELGDEHFQLRLSL
mmetsp:Transcript_9070/g.16612  ORF Transcript_9070/g.16612 Transcript_9070/m.16612 type:complete len:367 (-) Transcript_9070:55-1155(-)